MEEITKVSSSFNKIAGLAGKKTLKGVWDLRQEIAFYMDSEGKQHEFSNAQCLSKLVFLGNTV